MKRVSFEVAKAIKEAGYPQEYESFYSNDGELHVNMSYEYKTYMYKNQIGYSAPTYFEVWLWLWQEKKIILELQCQIAVGWSTPLLQNRFFNNQEEAIEAAIEYLVENDLIK